jgi:hypothetical protein
MSSFSDCAVEPEPEPRPGPVPLRRLSAAVPLRPRLLLASMLVGGCCFSVLSPRLPSGPWERASFVYLGPVMGLEIFFFLWRKDGTKTNFLSINSSQLSLPVGGDV